MKLVCLKRDGAGRTFYGPYTADDKRDGKVPMWQKADGSVDKAATRREQFYHALRNSAARQALLGIERKHTGSGAQFLTACEAAWAEPGSAMETVARVKQELGNGN